FARVAGAAGRQRSGADAIASARRCVAGRRADSRPVQTMTIGEILSGVPLIEPIAPELAAVDAAGLDFDSRRIGPGFLFFAFPGSKVDGRRFAQDAMAKGAVAVVSEEAAGDFAGPWIQVEHGRKALALAARNFY